MKKENSLKIDDEKLFCFVYYKISDFIQIKLGEDL
jgi:hypothetical protein